MNKNELVKKVANNTGVSQVKTALVLESILDEIVADLDKGNKVSLKGFGIFKPRVTKGGLRRNPLSGESVMTPTRTRPSFKSSKVLVKDI